MAEHRPKLLLVEASDLPVDAIASALTPHFEIIRVGPTEALERLDSSSAAAVLSPTEGSRGLLSRVSRWQADSLLDAIGEGVCLCRTDGRIVWANERFQAYDQTMQQRIAQVCAEVSPKLAESAQRAGSVHAAGSRKVSTTSPDQQRHYDVVISPATLTRRGGEQGDGEEGGESVEVRHVAAVVWDVTTARRTEQKIDAIDRAGRELVRLDADLVRELDAAQRLKLLEDRIVRCAHDLLRFDNFTVHMVDEQTGKLELVMYKGLPEQVQEIDLYASREGNGITGYVAATGRSYICHDTSADERYITGLESAGSSLTVPLFMHDKVIGVFNVESERVGAFTEDDRQFAEIFARYVALAFHILDLLVVERSTTSQTVSGVVEGELSEPLEDLATEAQWLREQSEQHPEVAPHAQQILTDIDSIRQRVTRVKRGPRTILGVEQAMRDAPAEPLLQGKRILVVDDEENIRETIRDVLERRGCDVAVFQTGEEAINALGEAADGDEASRFQLVLSDIKLADRTGYEVFSAAKRLGPEVGVILMTGFGYDPHHSIVRASQEGLQCVLFKPFQAQRLLEEVRKALSDRRDAASK